MLLTTNEIKEQLSHVYVRAIASCEGFVVERVAHDRDSVDVWIEAHVRAASKCCVTFFSPIATSSASR